jgi:hypothetical protein
VKFTLAGVTRGVVVEVRSSTQDVRRAIERAVVEGSAEDIALVGGMFSLWWVVTTLHILYFLT